MAHFENEPLRLKVIGRAAGIRTRTTCSQSMRAAITPRPASLQNVIFLAKIQLIPAPVAQWIEQRSSKALMRVRFLPGVPRWKS